MSFSSFWSFFHGLFVTRSPIAETESCPLETDSPLSIPSVLQPVRPKGDRFFLSPQELDGVRKLQERHKLSSEAATIRVAISRFEERLKKFGELRGSIVVPPPTPEAGALHFAIGGKAETRLRTLCALVHISDENTVMRIAVRDLLINNRIGL